ncbi:glycerate kinase [Flexivirga sp. B27]
MRVLICSDRWAELSATDITSAIAAGWRERQPTADVLTVPFSCGGAGFVDSLSATLAPTPDEVWRLRDGTTHYLDGALLTSSGGSARLGTALADSVDSGARRIVVGVGGAGDVDGGADLLHTLGDSDDLEVALRRAEERVSGIELVAAYQGDTPLVGLKGASAVAVELLGWTRQQAQDHERRIGEFADRAKRIRPPRTDLLTGKQRRLDLEPGSGAGGGAGFALGVLGARLAPGADVFAESVGFGNEVARADLVAVATRIFDWRSLAYDTVATTVAAAVAAATPAILLAEEVEVGRRETMSLGASAAYPLVDPRSLRHRDDPDTLTGLTALARRLAGTWSAA